MPGPGKILRLFQEENASVALRYCASYLGYRLLGRRLLSIEDICYHEWRRQNAPSASALEAMRRESAGFGHRPLISVIMPVYNTDAAMLRKAALSVERQVYPDWELCIADDCSTRADTRAELETLAARGGSGLLDARRDPGIERSSFGEFNAGTGKNPEAVPGGKRIGGAALLRLVSRI